MKFLAVLFDLDGTLLDTLEDIAASMNAALARNGYPPHPVERYRQYVGGGMDDLARKALPDGCDDETARSLAADMRSEYSMRWADRTRPYPGIRTLLDGLRDAYIRSAVLSNKPDDFTSKLCTRFFQPADFEIVRGALEGVPKKPDPTAALSIARRMGIEPARFLFLGDSGSDMRMALAAGMHPAAALWGFRSVQELTAAGVKTLLAKPEELLGIINNAV
jgi:phosphoglycolate phosphatase